MSGPKPTLVRDQTRLVPTHPTSHIIRPPDVDPFPFLFLLSVAAHSSLTSSSARWKLNWKTNPPEIFLIFHFWFHVNYGLQEKRRKAKQLRATGYKDKQVKIFKKLTINVSVEQKPINVAILLEWRFNLFLNCRRSLLSHQKRCVNDQDNKKMLFFFGKNHHFVVRASSGGGGSVVGSLHI